MPSRSPLLLAGCLTAWSLLLFIRLWMPAEATRSGDTIWLVPLGLLVAGITTFASPLSNVKSLRAQFGLVEWGAILLLAGVLCAAPIAGFLLSQSSLNREALNLWWEWLGTAAMIWTAAILARTFPDCRAPLVWQFCVVMTCIAGMAIWQSVVWYPAIDQQYQPLIARLVSLEASNSETMTSIEQLQRQKERQSLSQQLSEAGIPAANPARALFAQRLASREPFGFFALANTLAGFLAAALVCSLSLLVSAFAHSKPNSTRSLLVGCCLLLMLAVLLTKSRTAWAAAVLCGVIIPLLRNRLPWSFARRFWPFILGGFSILVIVVTVIGITGQLDLQVISEAPKSLQYRLDYWTATSRLIADHPLLGIGLGRFQQLYLPYKLARSSEEIADPHQWLLEAWCQGGILSFIGTVLACLGLVRRSFSRGTLADASSQQTNSQLLASRAITASVFVSLVAVWAGQLFWLGISDDRLLACLVGWILIQSLVYFFGRQPQLLELSHSIILSVASLTLAVHLMGAGGFGMPVVIQWLLVLGLFNLPASGSNLNDGFLDSSPAEPPHPGWLKASRLTLVIVFIGLGLASQVLAVGPVSSVQAQLTASDAALQMGAIERAKLELTRAAESDERSGEANRRLADLLFREWQSTSKQQSTSSETTFATAIGHQEQAIKRDGPTYSAWDALAEMHEAHHQQTKTPASLAAALQSAKQGVTLHPTNSRLQLRYARLLARAGQPEAGPAAQIVLEQDNLNRQFGHQDRYLSPAEVAEMQAQALSNAAP